jgi:hypothetical protein
MSTAVMRTTPVISAFVDSITVLMVVVAAFDVGIVAESSFNESLDSFIAIAADTAKELDTCVGKRHLCATADASANQYVGIKRHQNRRKRAVSLAIGINNCAVCDFAVLHGIYLKLFGVAEMLKNLSVFMCYCNFHNLFPRFIKLLFIALRNSLRSHPSDPPA